MTKSFLLTAKPLAYPNNGTGRDTYIGINNGGLYKKYEPYPSAEVGTFRFKRYMNNPLAHIDSKHVGYFTNGTGRDTYISLANGGFYP